MRNLRSAGILRRPAARRSAWVAFSQCVTSLSSFLLAVLVGRTSTAEAFGYFTLGFLAYVTVLSLARALVMEPLAIRYGVTATDPAGVITSAASAALGVGTMAGAVLAACALVASGEMGRVLFMIGLILPGLIMQDFWRFAFFTLATPRKAAASDCLWFALQVASSGLVLVTGASVVRLVAAWGCAGCVAAAWGIAQARVRPGGGGTEFVRQHRALGGAFLTDFLVMRGTSYAVVVALVPMVGAAAVGGLRGVLVLYGPYTTVLFGIASSVLAEGGRFLARRPDHFLGSQRLISLAMALLAALWGLALLAMPATWGRAVLGDTWRVASPLILPVGAGQVASGLAAGSLMGLRVLAAGRALVRVRVLGAATTLVLGVLGALHGVTAAAWGMTCGALVLAIGAWLMLARHSPPRPSRHTVEAAVLEIHPPSPH